MFYRKVPNTVLNTNPNLKSAFLLQNSKNYFFSHNLTLRETTVNDVLKRLTRVKDELKTCIGNGVVLRTFQNHLKSFPTTLKSQSSNILRVWAHQCECVFAQRLRRGQQMFCLYNKLWEERALKEFMQRMRNQITRRGKELMFSSAGVAAYNWQANRISDGDMDMHLNELQYIRLLTEKTISCENCKIAEPAVDTHNVTYCSCLNKAIFKNRTYENWVPFIQRQDMLIWRRLHKSGSYEYKCYGSFNDVSAEDFLNVQIDTEYRRTWDTTAVSLQVIEQDKTPNSNSDIIYWEMLWPKLFTNRDYVFNRRFKINTKKNKIIIMSRCTKHPACPPRRDAYRIDDYWSVMVIQPYSQLNKPGIEFALTYFDNPGVNIPSPITTWVAMRALPDFLVRLRAATKDYRAFCKKINRKCVYDFQDSNVEEVGQYLDYDWDYDDYDDFIFDNTVYEPQHPLTRLHRVLRPPPDEPPEREDGKMDLLHNPISQMPSTSEVSNSTQAVAESNNNSYWKYLHPKYYFS